MKTSKKQLALAASLALSGFSTSALAVTVSNITSLTTGGYTGVSVNGLGNLSFDLDAGFTDTAATSGGFLDSISFTLTADAGEFLTSLNLTQFGYASSGTANSAKTIATSTLVVDGMSTPAGSSVSLKSGSGSAGFSGSFALTGANTPTFTFAPNTTSANITLLSSLAATGLGSTAVRESIFLRLESASINVQTTPAPVPLPASALLLAPGLLVLLRRRNGVQAG